MFKSQGMHVNTELRVTTRSVSAVMLVSCPGHESCQSILVCVCVCVSASVFVHFFYFFFYFFILNRLRSWKSPAFNTIHARLP